MYNYYIYYIYPEASGVGVAITRWWLSPKPSSTWRATATTWEIPEQNGGFSGEKHRKIGKNMRKSWKIHYQ
jgi:disulfide bond formation protein DsbB